jgi:nitrate reductase gamma subunit
MDFVFARLFSYVTAAIFVAGVTWRLAEWIRIPVPFHLTLFPVPKSLPGKIRLFVAEFLFGRTLYQRDRILWILTILFHVSLAMVLAGHLIGIYFLREQFTLIGLSAEASRTASLYLGGVTGLVMTGSLAGLIYRRVAMPDIKRLSEADNYISLFLILAIALSGMVMYLPGFQADLPAIRSFAGGLFSVGPLSVPHNNPFVVHFVLAGLLLLYFPFSRMLHAASFFVIRAMLVETPPEYPTPPGIKQRSAFAIKKVSPDIPVSREACRRTWG